MLRKFLRKPRLQWSRRNCSSQRRAGLEACACLAIPGAVPASRRATGHFRLAFVQSWRGVRALANRVLAPGRQRQEMPGQGRCPVPGCRCLTGLKRLSLSRLNEAQRSMGCSHILQGDIRIVFKIRETETETRYPNVELSFHSLARCSMKQKDGASACRRSLPLDFDLARSLAEDGRGW